MLTRRWAKALSAFAAICGTFVQAEYVDPARLDSCPGYNAVNVTTSNDGRTITADLVLAGTACNVFGEDLQRLRLQVEYQGDNRIHLKIDDPVQSRYEVPESVFPRPGNGNSSLDSPVIQFTYTTTPFSFNISRVRTNETLFSTSPDHPLIFEPQYLRIKSTGSPADANIYGLGEHTETFRLPTKNLTRTFWSRDSYGIPTGTNLYGNHPIYFEHRLTGTHGVFLLNSNGMDIKINDTQDGLTSVEYNVIGGILDFYFFAGSDPLEVSREYAQITGTPAEVPYWSFGLHQCRFGYQNFVDVAGVITNYSAAGIPLETMWTDIDYMDRRRVFTLDPEYFPLSRMREIVDHLHSNGQKYIVMVDPALGYFPNEGYAPVDRGLNRDIFLKWPNGSVVIGVVWPGPTVWPDWFHPNVQDFWNGEFEIFFNETEGLNIDGVWIDMNEPASFCNLPCIDPWGQSRDRQFPPPRALPPPDINTPIFVNKTTGNTTKIKRSIEHPPYAISNAAPAGDLSATTAPVNATHFNNLTEYDVHNLYGTMMSTATHLAMLNRRPGLRTLVITRSTFAGAGRQVGKWLGDNLSTWEQYRFSIAGMLGFTSIYQIPMVGSDICGFGDNTTETLCARWAMLGGFSPFMRNHNQDTSISQEFYRWPLVTQAAKNVLDIRYRLLDYIYTTFHTASLDGTPVVQPLFYQFPNDTNTFGIEHQFLYGSSILVSPVTEENSTSVQIYLPPEGRYYDFLTFAPEEKKGNVILDNVDFTHIPVHIVGGVVLPLRVEGAMTTDELRKKDFEIVVAPDADGKAKGRLYVDDGVSIDQSSGQTHLEMGYEKGSLRISGEFGFGLGVKLRRVRVLGVSERPTGNSTGGVEFEYDEERKVVSVELGVPFDSEFSLEVPN
ncbi:alpha-glucosidase [Marasmius fiardii PR-910]|nr:alpha-glucosidase [Marasmius fiardii PR-910]